MRFPWSVPVLLVLAALAGYATGARPVQAQADSFPFQVGDIVSFYFPDADSRECLIEQVRGAFAKCVNPSDRQGPTIGRREPPDYWVNVANVESVTRRKPER